MHPFWALPGMGIGCGMNSPQSVIVFEAHLIGLKWERDGGE